MPIKKVFFSSTARDLKEYREAAYDAIEGLDGYHCVRMEDFGARDYESDEFCHARVEECNLFVGIVGHLYGSCPDGCETSYTEQEYDAAVGAEIPRLMFVATDAVSPPPSLRESDEIYEKQRTFRKRVDSERIRDSFESPEDLSGKIRQAIHNWEREQNKRSVQKRAARAPFQAPPLPEHFIPRPEKSEEVKRRLLTNISDRPGVLVVSALHGLGGIGKTVLASSLAHDEEVVNQFSDGILWATLGQEPDLLSLLSVWIQALGDYEFRPTTPTAASMHLSTLLHDATALLVVDDAWNSAHVQPFRVGGPRCSLVITTRDSLIAEAVDARVYDLDVMTEGQSLALLSKRLGRELNEAEQQEALDLAKEVGYLPLALNLIAAQVEDGVSWAELLEELRAEIARLEALEKPGVEELDEATRRNLSLRASFRLSIQSMPEKKRVAFSWLGVLPEDVLLSPKMATTLWNVDLRSARETLRYLRNKALLLPGPKLGDVQTYRIHDLLHDFSRSLMLAPVASASVTDPCGLGLTIQKVHSSLLERYRSQTIDGLWHTLPNDGYIYANLVWHMEKANKVEEIHALLREETAEGKNGWYQTRESLGQTSGFFEDIARAWQLTEFSSEAKIEKAETPQAFDLETRYALIIASINNLSANIPPNLIVLLVEHNIWSIAQGLAYARQKPNPEQRYYALRLLSFSLCVSFPKEALIIAREIKDESVRARALAEIAPRLPDPEDALLEALLVASDIKDKGVKASTLAEIAIRLPDPEETLLEALLVASDIKDEGVKAKALAEIAPKLLHTEVALSVARNITDFGYRAIAIAGIVPKLSDPEEALAVSREIMNLKMRAVALAEIATELTGSQKADVLNESARLIKKIDDDFDRAKSLIEIAPRLSDPEEALKEAVSIASEIRDKDVGAKIRSLPWIGYKRLDPEESRSIAMEIKDMEILESVRSLAEIASKLPESHKAKVLDVALELIERIKGQVSKGTAMAEIAPTLSEPKRTAALDEALKLVKKIGDESSQEKALAGIAPWLAKLQDALNIIKYIKSRNMVLNVMARIVPKLTGAQKDGDKDKSAMSCRSLSEPAPKIEKGYLKARLTAEMASDLPEPLKTDAIKETIAVVQTIDDEVARAWTLAEIAPHLPELQDAIAMAREIKNLVTIQPPFQDTRIKRKNR